MTVNLRQFNARVARFASSDVREAATQVQRKAGLQVLSGVVLKTPVDTGRARGGWQVDVGGVRTPPTVDRSGSAPIAAGTQLINGLNFGDVITILNNVNYIVFLEEGSSSQAPQGMVRKTLQEVGAQFL